MYRLANDQIATLVSMIRRQLGDRLKHDEFTDAVLHLFEDIPGFETLPFRHSKSLTWILWQRYESACRAPKRRR